MRKLKLEILLSTGITLLLMVLAGCNVGNNAIFYTLEHEEKIIDNTLPNNIAVMGIVRDGDYYYAAAGAIYRATVTERSNNGWKLIESFDTGGTSPGLCNRLVLFSGNNQYYASFFKDDASGNINYGLYSASSLSASVTWNGPLGTDSDIKSKQVTGIYDVNGNLIVTVYNNANRGYDLYYSSDGISFSKVTFGGVTGSLTENITDVAYFGSKFWVVSGSRIFNGTSISSLSELANYPSDVTASAEYEGIYASTAFSKTLLYLSDNMGEIFTSSDGVSWTKSPDSPVKVSSNSVPFGKFVQVSNDLLLVATKGYGFYKITQTNSLTRFSDNTKANLYNGVILGFYIDTTDSNIFIYTAGSGLWSNTLAGISDDKSWKWE